MNLCQIDISHLIVLKHLLERKHVSNTAQALNISQPSVSRSLQKCRALFKDELLVRVSHGYELTPKAESVKAELSAMLASLERLVHNQEFDPKTCQKSLKVFGLVPQVNWLLPKVFQYLREHAPLLTLELDTVPKRHFDALIAGDVHFVLSTQQPPSSEQNIYRSFIASRDFRLLMSADHPLAEQELTPEKLAECQFGQISLHGDRNLSIEQRFRDLGLSDRSKPVSTPLMLTNFNVAPAMAEHSDVIFHLPTPFAEEACISRNLVARPVPEGLRSPYQDVYLYWHKRYHNDDLCMWVREVIKQLYIS
ncbi:LysR family transcriptional regulator [Photobacterium sp. ZSDE20]|uniref:LysR family transcriptional regulator n=1 Tax=Photobacterium pectinilyticum TaxID=2906793 RepID=A0ABT1N751_9GAMM|nr:LysR family transcriptional regulator [Photobacterium sp. ZSDE20]MCQ1060576.1 LysR family transcriptional regulator [Photobacterium sp. ZSDE20]MDD1828094.1 LysR family transcriptional regulator [Photobacterium sp. ZSDE20]